MDFIFQVIGRKDSMRIWPFILTFWLLSSSSLDAKTCTPQSGPAARADVTDRGLEKIITQSLNSGSQNLKDRLLSMPLRDLRGGLKKAECARKSYRKNKTIKELWTECPGLPKFFKDEGSQWSEALLPLPTQFELVNNKIKDIQLGAIEVQCVKGKCDIRVPIQKLDMISDFHAFEVVDRGRKKAKHMKSLMRLMQTNFGLQCHEGKCPSFQFKVTLDGEKDLKEIVTLPEQFIDIDLKTQQVRLNNEIVNDLLQDTVLEADKRFLKEKKKLKEKIIAEYKGSLFKNTLTLEEYIKRETKKRDSEIFNEVFDRRMKQTNAVKGSFTIFSYLMARDLHRADDSVTADLMKIFTDLIGKKIADHSRNILNPKLQNLPFLHKGYRTKLSIMGLNDLIEGGKIKKEMELYRDKLNLCLRKMAIICPYNKIIQFLKIFESKKNMSDLKTLKKFAEDVEKLADIKSFKVKKLAPLHQQIKRSMDKLNQNIEKELVRNSLILGVTDLQQANDLVTMGIGICISCESVSGNLETKKVGPTLSTKDYDLGIGVRLSSLNDFLRALHKKGGMKLCINKSRARLCRNRKSSDTLHTVNIKTPPRVVYDQGIGTYKLVIDNLKKGHHFGGIKAWFLTGSENDLHLEIPFIFKNMAEGKKIGLEIPDKTIKLQKNGVNPIDFLDDVILVALQPVVGGIYSFSSYAAQAFINDVIENELEAQLEKGVSIDGNEYIESIQKIDSHPDGPYFHFNLK